MTGKAPRPWSPFLSLQHGLGTPGARAAAASCLVLPPHSQLHVPPWLPPTDLSLPPSELCLLSPCCRAPGMGAPSPPYLMSSSLAKMTMALALGVSSSCRMILSKSMLLSLRSWGIFRDWAMQSPPVPESKGQRDLQRRKEASGESTGQAVGNAQPTGEPGRGGTLPWDHCPSRHSMASFQRDPCNSFPDTHSLHGWGGSGITQAVPNPWKKSKIRKDMGRGRIKRRGIKKGNNSNPNKLKLMSKLPKQQPERQKVLTAYQAGFISVKG